jgi:hypothetical protein
MSTTLPTSNTNTVSVFFQNHDSSGNFLAALQRGEQGDHDDPPDLQLRRSRLVPGPLRPQQYIQSIPKVTDEYTIGRYIG